MLLEIGAIDLDKPDALQLQAACKPPIHLVAVKTSGLVKLPTAALAGGSWTHVLLGHFAWRQLAMT